MLAQIPAGYEMNLMGESQLHHTQCSGYPQIRLSAHIIFRQENIKIQDHS